MANNKIMHKDVLIDVSSVVHQSGNAWYTRLPKKFRNGDTLSSPKRSTLVLYENNKKLGPPHQLHDWISVIGMGGYSHWGDGLIFSSSNNSSPINNGFKYSINFLENTSDYQPSIFEFPHYCYPSIVGIETINSCNARCVFCPLFSGNSMMDRDKRPPTVMTMDLFKSVLDQIDSWPLTPGTIFLNMNGEPLLDPYIKDRFLLIKSYDFASNICLQTNGQLLNSEIAHSLLNANVSNVTFGFDGATKKTYEAHRIRCNYDVVLQNIRMLASLRDASKHQTSITIKFVRTKSNLSEMFATWALFNEFLSPELDKFEDVLSVDWSDNLTEDSFYYIPRIPMNTKRRQCDILNYQLIVLADGKVAACCWDYNLNVSMGGYGDLNNDSCLNIWRNEKHLDLVRRISQESPNAIPQKCRACPSLYEKNIVPETNIDMAGIPYSLADNGITYSFTR